jgi:hypothetical protein
LPWDRVSPSQRAIYTGQQTQENAERAATVTSVPLCFKFTKACDIGSYHNLPPKFHRVLCRIKGKFWAIMSLKTFFLSYL